MIDYVDKRERWKVLSLGFLLFITFFSLSFYVSSLVFYKWLGIPFGCTLILFAIIPHRLGKKNSALYLASVSLNAVGTGFAVAAYYIVKAKPVTMPALVLVPLCVIGAYTLVNILISVFGHKKLFVSIFCSVFGIALAFCVVFWIIGGYFVASFGFFNILFLEFFLAVSALTLGNPERAALRDLSFGAFGSFVVAVMIVVAILSEGDVIDGLDISDVTSKNKKAAKSAEQAKIPKV